MLPPKDLIYYAVENLFHPRPEARFALEGTCVVKLHDGPLQGPW